ncbi:transposase [Streptomyces sp. NPDC006855]|uniref:transposase n=1 Tax=Streptomyces sp. NPDC006855 TaxID=3364765 RepID=UPI0036CF56A7
MPCRPPVPCDRDGRRTSAVGQRHLITLLRPKAPKAAERLVEDIFAALDKRTVVAPGTDAAAVILPKLAAYLAAPLDQPKELKSSIGGLLEAHSLSEPPTPTLEMGVRTGARYLIDVGDGSTFPAAGHLDAYAGLAPDTRRSGVSFLGESPYREGDKHLGQADFTAALASLSAPASMAYHERKQVEGTRQGGLDTSHPPPCRRALRDGAFFRLHTSPKQPWTTTEQPLRLATKQLGTTRGN